MGNISAHGSCSGWKRFYINKLFSIPAHKSEDLEKRIFTHEFGCIKNKKNVSAVFGSLPTMLIFCILFGVLFGVMRCLGNYPEN